MTTGWTPGYVRVVEDLRGKITRGELGPGAQLPSEARIRQQYDVSSTVAKRAVAELRAAGLVISQQGRGVFVREHRPLVRVSPWRYWRHHPDAAWLQEAETAGRRVEVEHETVTIRAGAQLAERLALEEGDEVVQTRYRVLMDGTPATALHSWEPAALTAGTDIADPHAGPHANTGIVGRFDSIGMPPDSVQEDVSGRMPTTEEAQRLDVAPGVPLMCIAQTFRSGDTVVEVADILIPADRYTLSFRMPIP